MVIVLLLGIFRTAPCPSATRGCPCALYFPGSALPFKKEIFLLVIYDTSSIRKPPKVAYKLNVLKLEGKHFIDHKLRSPCTTQRSLYVPALLKSWQKH
jgi:hypothetical protein